MSQINDLNQTTGGIIFLEMLQCPLCLRLSTPDGRSYPTLCEGSTLRYHSIAAPQLVRFVQTSFSIDHLREAGHNEAADSLEVAFRQP